MGITMKAFRIAMEMYGAEPLANRDGISLSEISPPCFKIKGVEFVHSGTDRITVTGYKSVPKDILNAAMSVFGEVYPGKSNFWYEEICSIEGMLTLAAMLEGKYSKDLIGELTNKTYKKLLESLTFPSSSPISFVNSGLPEREKFYKLVKEFDNIINPYGNRELQIKEPIEYMGQVFPEVATSEEGQEPYARLILDGKSVWSSFYQRAGNWEYQTSFLMRKDRKNYCINMRHYSARDNETGLADEIIHIKYSEGRKTKTSDEKKKSDFDLKISLRTGLAWKNGKEQDAKPTTKKQVGLVISYLKISIKKIKKNIIIHMVEAND